MDQTIAFQMGDTVRLKSGGPKMTIAGVEASVNFVRCQWFAGAKLNVGSFAPAALEHATADESKSST